MSAEPPQEPTLRQLLATADHVLSRPDSPEHVVDRVVDEIAALDDDRLTDDRLADDRLADDRFPGEIGATQIDPVVLQRVIAALTARRAAVAVELADLGRQRAELARRHRGVAGYTRSGG